MAPIIIKPIVIDMEKLKAEKRAKRRSLLSVKRYPLEPHQINAYYGLPEPGESTEDTEKQESDEALNQKENNAIPMELDQAEDIQPVKKLTKEASNKETKKRQPATSIVKPATKQNLRNKKKMDPKDIGVIPMELDEGKVFKAPFPPVIKKTTDASSEASQKHRQTKSTKQSESESANPATKQPVRRSERIGNLTRKNYSEQKKPRRIDR